MLILGPRPRVSEARFAEIRQSALEAKARRAAKARNQRLSDMYKNPSKPPAPGSEKSYVTARVMLPNPVQQAAIHFIHDHGVRALNGAIEDLLKDLFAG